MMNRENLASSEYTALPGEGLCVTSSSTVVSSTVLVQREASHGLKRPLILTVLYTAVLYSGASRVRVRYGAAGANSTRTSTAASGPHCCDCITKDGPHCCSCRYEMLNSRQLILTR